MNHPLVFGRIFLILSLGAALWMIDCAGTTSVQRKLAVTRAKDVPQDLQQALRGCSVGVAAELTGSLQEFSLLLPTPEDRAEAQLGLRRDFIFMGAYTLGYLGLAWMLWHRRRPLPRQQPPAHGVSGRPLAVAAVALSLITVGCDISENLFTFRVLPRLSGDYTPPPAATTDPHEAVHASQMTKPPPLLPATTDAHEAAHASQMTRIPAPTALATTEPHEVEHAAELAGAPKRHSLVTATQAAAAQPDMTAKQRASYGKWLANGALCMVLAFVFIRQGRSLLPKLACGCLFLGGLVGLLGGAFKPALIEPSVLLTIVGSIFGTLWLLRQPGDSPLFTARAER